MQSNVTPGTVHVITLNKLSVNISVYYCTLGYRAVAAVTIASMGVTPPCESRTDIFTESLFSEDHVYRTGCHTSHAQVEFLWLGAPTECIIIA